VRPRDSPHSIEVARESSASGHGRRPRLGRLSANFRPPPAPHTVPANPALTPHAPGLDTRSACPRECEQPQRLVHQRLAQRPTPGAARL